MVIYFLDLFGVLVFAITGSLRSGKKNMDIFGVLVVASITALGGGTIRDLMLGVQPVFWVSDPWYIIISLVGGLGTFIYSRFYQPPAHILLIADAFGLAIFTVIGCRTTLSVTKNPIITVLMGIITGVLGGIMRDILCGEIPLILRKEIYATASFVGALSYILLLQIRLTGLIGVLFPVMIILTIRIASVHWEISLPTFKRVKK